MLYIQFEETREGGRALSDEAYAERETEYIRHEIIGVGLAPHGSDWQACYDLHTPTEELELLLFLITFTPGKPIFLVEVTYGDGDTFGHTVGSWQVLAATETLEKAEIVATSIKNAVAEPYRQAFRPTQTEKSAPNIWHGSRPWEGYFNRFGSVNIIELVLQE